MNIVSCQSQEEKYSMYKCTAAIMHFGNSTWKQRPREEQAEAETTEDCEKVAHLLEIDAADMIKGLLKPRIKVRTSLEHETRNVSLSHRSATSSSTKVKARIKSSTRLVLCPNRCVPFNFASQPNSSVFLCKNEDVPSYVLLARRTCQRYSRCQIETTILHRCARHCRLRNLRRKPFDLMRTMTMLTFFAVQWFRATVHQLHQRTSSTVLQSSYVRLRTGRIQEGRHSMGVHRFRHGSSSLYRLDRKGAVISWSSFSLLIFIMPCLLLAHGYPFHSRRRMYRTQSDRQDLR